MKASRRAGRGVLQMPQPLEVSNSQFIGMSTAFVMQVSVTICEHELHIADCPGRMASLNEMPFASPYWWAIG